MNKKDLLHKGFTSTGDTSLIDNGFNNLSEAIIKETFIADNIEELESEKEEFGVQRDCTILWWNGQYQKPNIKIINGWIRFSSRHRNVDKIQLRSVPGGGIRYIKRLGEHRIPNGDYVLSLWGSTYGYKSIKACVEYRIE